MEIQRLRSEIIANIRSSSTINNVTQCITELVLNSLDSKSTSIAVRVNLITFKIQVVDNGEGITKKDLELVGLRYMTNKCSNLVHLEKLVKYHGFRGEALASIIDISKKVNITSKHISSTETYSKNFSKHTSDQIISVKNRPSFGTTVTVEGFLNNLPIRRNRLVPELELEDIKRSIESLIIMYPNVSFSVRNDLSGNLIINSRKNKDIISSFKYLYPEIDEEFSLMKVSKDKVTVEALLFKGLFTTKHLQYVYVNRRPVHCPKIQKFVSNIFFKNKNFEKRKSLNSKIINDKNKYPVYVINIKCPHSHVDILLNPSKTMVEFKNWTIILQCLEKLVYSFFGNRNKLSMNSRYLTAREEFKSSGGVSQIYGALKSYGYKRKQPKEDLVQAKVQKLSQNSEVIEESVFVSEDAELANATIMTIKSESDFIQETPFVDGNCRLPFDKHEKCRKDEKTPNEMCIEDEQMNLFLDKHQDSIGQKLSFGRNKINKNVDISVSDNAIYNISDTTPAKKTKVKAFKKPLPIKIKHKKVKTENLRSLSKIVTEYHSNMNVSPCINENRNCNTDSEIPAIKNTPNQSTLKLLVPKKLDDEKSTLSKFTADENKGKNLIMDMFLKSTQVYTTEEDNLSDARSDETILEVESNFLLENNIQTKVNGLSKTMSVSVNIRSTKKIKRQKFKANRTEKANRTLKCIQTTLDANGMVSKCIQTTIDQDFVKSKSQLQCNNLNDSFDSKKPAENYTIVLSDNIHSNETPHFRFVYQSPSRFNLKQNNEFSPYKCNCNCHLNTDKIFHFVDSVYKKNKIQATYNTLNGINIFGSGCDLNEINASPIGKVHVNRETENYKDIRCKVRKPVPVETKCVQNYGPVKPCAKSKRGNCEDMKHTTGAMRAEMNCLEQNFNHQKQPPDTVFHRNYEPVEFNEADKRENYEYGTTRNPMQVELNRFVQDSVQQPVQVEMNHIVRNYALQKQHLDKFLHRNYEPAKLREGGKKESYEDVARNPIQAEMNHFLQNYVQNKQHLDNVHRNYEPVKKLHENGKIKNYEDIKLTAKNPVPTEMNPFVQDYDQCKQHLNNVLYKNYERPSKGIPNITHKPHREGFVTKQKRNSKSLQDTFNFDRSPYFVPSQNTLYPKTNRFYENKFNKANLTPHPVKNRDFLNIAPNNTDSYILFDPQYRSTQLSDFNKNNDLNSNICCGRGIENTLVTEISENDFTIDHFGNFQPAYKSTQHNDMKCPSMENAQLRNEASTPFAECNQSSFNSQLNLINVSEDISVNFNPFDHFVPNLEPVCKNTQNNLDKKIGEELEHKTFVFGEFNNQNNSNTHVDLEPVRQTTQEIISRQKDTEFNGHSDEQSELIITVSNHEKQELLRRELNAERDLNAKKYSEWYSPSTMPRLQEDIQSSDQEFGKEWVKRKNNFGSSFYINKRTGFTTFFTPKPDDNQFKFGRRFEFMPKGSSPILKDVKQVDKSLNQKDKDKLQGYILESHQNELLIVKWQNYIKHNDPKTFFDEVYKEKLKLFEECLPKLNAFDKKKYVSELDDVMHFNKTLFDSIDVIGQLDGKFIAVVEKTRNLLVLFDQHAVHERIRLEELLKVYTNAKIKQLEILNFFIPQNDLSLLKKHELYLSSLGLSVEFFVNGINILEIPVCIHNKFKDNDNQNSLSEIIKLLINEIIELLKETRGVSFGNHPRIIQNVIKLEACRGAIKFGDNLSKKDCVNLLGRLAVCKLPFQCAHGRPTLTPLVRLDLTRKCVPYKVNLKKVMGILGR